MTSERQRWFVTAGPARSTCRPCRPSVFFCVCLHFGPCPCCPASTTVSVKLQPSFQVRPSRCFGLHLRRPDPLPPLLPSLSQLQPQRRTWAARLHLHRLDAAPTAALHCFCLSTAAASSAQQLTVATGSLQSFGVSFALHCSSFVLLSSLSVCLSVCVSVSVSVSMSVSASACVFVFVSVIVCMFLCEFVHWCMASYVIVCYCELLYLIV